MTVGDLVKYVCSYRGTEWKETGVIVREIPGWANVKVVHWSVSGRSSHPAKDLKVVNSGRS